MKNSHRDFFTNNMLDKILRNTENHDFEDIKFLCGLYNNKKKIYGIMTTNNSANSICPFIHEKIKFIKNMWMNENERIFESWSYVFDSKSTIYNKRKNNISYYTVRSS
ncbi:hypothetical protein POCGH01_00195900 [Plasmodium ovale]|uniref:PIR protein n=1 Tax=Plasmodium ovale TaxID=36330 RepID=A0A1D3JEU6_PLAOA|nr:hypothetical protein POCGH01_00195900 [Plasmodium ovale]